MKRKLVRMGAHSYMSAIPKKWIEKHNLKKGDHVNFTEVDNKLILTSTAEIYERKTEITIDYPNVIVWRMLQPVYTSGYDEVKINFKDPNTLKKIEELMNILIGFEIIETNPKYVIVKSVSKQFDEDIQPILKRTWQIFKQSALIVENAFKNKDKTRLNEVHALEQTINKYTMLMKRIINRTGYKYPHYTYMMIVFLELASNHYEYIRRHFDYYPKARIKKEYYNEIKKVNKLLFDVYDLQYNYTQEKFNKIALELLQFKLFEDTSDDIIKFRLKSIAEYLIHLSRSIISVKL